MSFNEIKHESFHGAWNAPSSSDDTKVEVDDKVSFHNEDEGEEKSEGKVNYWVKTEGKKKKKGDDDQEEKEESACVEGLKILREIVSE